MNLSKMDRTAFKAHTAEETSNDSAYYKLLTWQQRLAMANYFNSVAFNCPNNNPPKLDRTVIKVLARE